MRQSFPIVRRLIEAIRNRDWIGIGFELFVLVLGVILGLEGSRWVAAREEREYRQQMITALDRTLRNYELNGRQINQHIQTALSDQEKLASAQQNAPPPFLHITGLDRPPTRTWDALVATGIARSIDPELVLRLAIYFSRADAFGDQYHRYNQFTESSVLPFVSEPDRFYGRDGKLRPEYSSHTDRLRDLQKSNNQLVAEGIELRRLIAEG